MPTRSAPSELAAVELARKVAAGDRRALARAITLVESVRPEDRAPAEAVVRHLERIVDGGTYAATQGPRPQLSQADSVTRFPSQADLAKELEIIANVGDPPRSPRAGVL